MFDPQIGKVLKEKRVEKKLSLEELSHQTRIPISSLKKIEEGKFNELPGQVFVKGFILTYARALELSEEALLRHNAQGAESKFEPPLVSITPPEKENRFGIAMAIVIFIILLTLALSIILRPRYDGIPNELSFLSAEHCEA